MNTPQFITCLFFTCLGLWTTESGCATTNYDHGVPNLVRVDPNGLRPSIWRSGQPLTTDSWDYLARLGIRHVIKLDFEEEGSDAEAALRGVEVVEIPIEPTTKPGFADLVEDLFAKPSDEALASILDVLHRIKDSRGGITGPSSGGWLVHCKNGHDRTGLVVGLLRIVVDGWDKHHAWSEMLDRGYHPELIGLDRAFHDFTTVSATPIKKDFAP